MSSKMFDNKIVEAEFCFNKCKYNNRERNWCNYHNCRIDEISNCNFVYYDSHSKKSIVGERLEDLTQEEENKIREIIKQEQKEGKLG